jgi:hypothetical protein
VPHHAHLVSGDALYNRAPQVGHRNWGIGYLASKRVQYRRGACSAAAHYTHVL